MVILSERGTTWVFLLRSFSCIGHFLNSQILFVLLTGTLESFFSNRGWATGTEQSLSSVWKRIILQQDNLNRDAIVQKGKQVYEEDQSWWSDHLSTDRVQSLWCTILILWSWKPFELNLLIGLGQGIEENKIHHKIIWFIKNWDFWVKRKNVWFQKNPNLTENTSHLRLFFGSVELPSSMEKEGGNFFTLTFWGNWELEIWHCSDSIVRNKMLQPHRDIKVERSNLFTVFAAPETRNISKNVEKLTWIWTSLNLICAFCPPVDTQVLLLHILDDQVASINLVLLPLGHRLRVVRVLWCDWPGHSGLVILGFAYQRSVVANFGSCKLWTLRVLEQRMFGITHSNTSVTVTSCTNRA